MKTLTAIALGLGIMAAPVVAQDSSPSCAPREAVVGHLAERYGEIVVMQGFLTGLFEEQVPLGQGLMEVMINPESGTWTMFLTMADGQSCFVASGQFVDIDVDGIDGAMPVSLLGDPA